MRSTQQLPRFFAAALLLSATPMYAATAAADENPSTLPRVVTYGDSYTANPSQLIGMANRTGHLTSLTADYPRTGQLASGKECLQAPDNWPRLMANKGLDVRDWSCTAQSSRTMLERIDASIDAGDLSRNTSAVIFPVGINNYGPWGSKDGVDISDFNAVQEAYLADMREAAARVRGAAPDATLIVAGMLQITAGDLYCAINVVPGHPGAIPVPVLSRAENSLRWVQQQTAADIGARFVDLKTASQGHDSCAPAEQRYVAGVVDTTTPDYKMIAHPSQAGQRFIAEQMTAALREA